MIFQPLENVGTILSSQTLQKQVVGQLQLMDPTLLTSDLGDFFKLQVHHLPESLISHLGEMHPQTEKSLILETKGSDFHTFRFSGMRTELEII